MIDQIKANLFTNWHLGRSLRLIFGIYATVQGVINQDILSGGIGLLFLYQAFTNTGCCGGNTCNTTQVKDSEQNIDNVEFEEIHDSTKK